MVSKLFCGAGGSVILLGRKVGGAGLKVWGSFEGARGAGAGAETAVGQARADWAGGKVGVFDTGTLLLLLQSPCVVQEEQHASGGWVLGQVSSTRWSRKQILCWDDRQEECYWSDPFLVPWRYSIFFWNGRLVRYGCQSLGWSEKFVQRGETELDAMLPEDIPPYPLAWWIIGANN